MLPLVRQHQYTKGCEMFNRNKSTLTVHFLPFDTPIRKNWYFALSEFALRSPTFMDVRWQHSYPPWKASYF